MPAPSINFKRLLWLLNLLIYSHISAQPPAAGCDFFEEKEGLLVVEMENLPLTENWETAQSIGGYTGNGYIQWTGSQSFNRVGQGPIRFQVQINTPGTYAFNWRVAVGAGSETTEHNDSWLKINGNTFYAQKGFNFMDRLKPKPTCLSQAIYDCPNGSTEKDFFKVFGGLVNDFVWKASTSDHDAHDIYTRFDTVGTYSIEVNARSSYHCIDRLILWHTDQWNSSSARRLIHTESACLSDLTTSVSEIKPVFEFRVYPNPARDHFRVEFDDIGEKEVVFRDLLGNVIAIYQTFDRYLDIRSPALPAGVYYLEVSKNDHVALRKVMLHRF